MNRLAGLFLALALGLWAQRILTGPEPGIPRDALILFVLASLVFVWNATPPMPLLRAEQPIRRSWPRGGLGLTLAGLGLGVVSLVLLWRDLHSLPGLLLWPLATALFVAGTVLPQPTNQPTNKLTNQPTTQPTNQPTTQPTNQPTTQPTNQPTNELPTQPTNQPESRGNSPSPLNRWLSAHWDLIILLIILGVAIFVRFYQLHIYPNGCQSDECNNGLDALKWLSGAAYTPYAETNEGQATFFTYLIALSFKLFGVGVTQMRMVSAFIGVLTVLVFYIFARDLYDRRAALAATALLATSRWHVTFSRIVYELIMQPLFMIVLFYFLLRALREGRRRDWALAGVSLAAGLNTYTGFRVVPFLVAAFLAFWVIRELVLSNPLSSGGRWLSSLLRRQATVTFAEGNRPAGAWQAIRQDLEGIGLMAGASFVAVLPLGVYVVQHWNVFTSRIRHISVMRDVERVGSNQPIWDNLRKTLYMFNWQGDNAALNNLPGAPMLDTLVGVLFVLGLAYSLWHALHGRSLPMLYVLWFAAILSLGVLSVAHEAPTARRTIGLVPLIYLLVALVLDQWFVTWDRVWRGLGTRTFGLAVAAVVTVVTVANARTYFLVQAPNPAVWNAYSPGESAVGRFLTTLPPDATVLITPQYEHHSAIKLIGRGHPYRALNPVADVPYRGEVDSELIYILEPVERPLLSLLQTIYPGGEILEHQDRTGQSHFVAYRVPKEELARTQGVVARFYSSFPPARAPEARRPVRELNLDMAQAPLPPPFFALFEGSVLVPEFGQYTFNLVAEGGTAKLQIGRQHRLGVGPAEQGSEVASDQSSLTVTLAAGFYPLRLEYRASEQPGRLWLTWSGPGFPEQVVGGDVLYAFQLGGQGLVGYYYPNPDWQGPPALVRNDLLIVPYNPLREPYSILWRGKIAIPEDGTYVFGTRSDDGSFVFIDGQLVVDNGGTHGAQDRQGSIRLSRGFHDIEVRYFEMGGSREMQLWWQPPGQGRAIIDTQYLFPLEGKEIPEGLAMPPPPQIVLPERKPEVGAGEVAEPQPGTAPPPSAQQPVTQPVGEFPPLATELIWEYGSCGVGQGQLNQPRGVAVDPATGAVYVADAADARIVKLDDDGEFDLTWGEAGEGPDQFQEPFDLVVEPDDNVLVLDAVAQRLLRFTPEGQFLATFGAELTFYRPRGLGVDAAGQLAVADTGGIRIVLLDPTGRPVGQVGGPDSDLAKGQPTDAVLTPTGDLYYVEAENGVITRLAADGSLQRWQGVQRASTIDGPHLAWRPAGGLYATDPEGQRVLLFDRGGVPLGQFGPEAGLMKPVGLAVVPQSDGSDLVVVTDSPLCRLLALRVSVP